MFSTAKLSNNHVRLVSSLVLALSISSCFSGGTEMRRGGSGQTNLYASKNESAAPGSNSPTQSTPVQSGSTTNTNSPTAQAQMMTGSGYPPQNPFWACVKDYKDSTSAVECAEQLATVNATYDDALASNNIEDPQERRQAQIRTDAAYQAASESLMLCMDSIYRSALQHCCSYHKKVAPPGSCPAEVNTPISITD